jgi:hypothetical protein
MGVVRPADDEERRNCEPVKDFAVGVASDATIRAKSDRID